MVEKLVQQWADLQARAARLEAEAFCDPSRGRQIAKLRAAERALNDARKIESQLRRLGVEPRMAR